MGLFEGESLPRSARQIDRALMNRIIISWEEISKEAVEETASFSGGGGWRSH